MSYEISQFDLPNRQLLPGNAKPRSNIFTEIGNAKITQSIFGRAKVHTICASDKIRRIQMLSTILVLTIIVAIWQLTEHADELLDDSASQPLNATVQVSPPAFLPEYIPPTKRRSDVRIPTQAELLQLTTRRPPPPPTPVKPATANPVATNTVPSLAGGAQQPPANPAVAHSPASVSPVATPTSTKPLSAPVPAPAVKPVTIAPVAAPINKPATTPAQPTAVKPAPTNAQP